MPAPVVLFVYNRPDHTRQTVDALAQNRLAKGSELWVFCDGPKAAGSREKVEAVREYISTLPNSDQFAHVRIAEAKENLGLADSIISGVTRVMEARGRAIVMEDDMVTAPDFLDYMNAGLEFYEDNPKIGSITGYSPLRHLPPGYREDVYLLPRSCSYGWATWSGRWTRVDWAVGDFKDFRHDRRAQQAFNQCGSDCTDMLFRQMSTDIDSWSIRFGYWQFRKGMNTVYPAISRVRPIGWDGSGVHSSRGSVRFNDEIHDAPVSFTLSTPDADPDVVSLVERLYSGPLSTRIARWLRLTNLGWVEAAGRTLLWRSTRP